MNRRRSFALVLAFSPLLARSAFADDPTPAITPFAFITQSGTYTNQSPTTVGGTGGYSAIVGWTAQDPDTLAFTGAASPDIVMSTDSGWGGDMWVYNASNVTLSGGDNTTTPPKSGGSVTHDLLALNTSTIIFADQGFSKEVEMYDTSQVIMNGGTIGILNNQTGYSFLGLQGSSTAHLSAGTIYGGIEASGSTTIIVSGTGIYGDLESDGIGSSVMMTSGFVSGGLAVDDGAVGGFQGGTVGSLDVGGGNASLTMTAGTCFGILYNGGAATLTMNGGTATGISVGGTGGVTTLAGGTINGDAYAGSGGTLYLNSGILNGSIYAQSGGIVILNGIAITGNASLTGGTLTLNSGSIGGNLTINGGTLNWNSSVSVAGSLILQGNTHLTLNRSLSGSIQLSNNATFELDGGTISGTLTAANLSSFAITGGSTGAVTLNDDSQIYISGGQIQGITGNTEAIVEITAPATITGDISMHGTSEALVEAGTVTGKLIAADSSSIYFYAGTSHGLEAHGYASLNWYGGTLAGSGTIPIYLNDGSTLNLNGIDLATTLLNANSGGYSVYALSGYQPDGTPLSNFQLFVQNPTTSFPGGASFNFSAADQNWNLTTGGSWAAKSNWLANVVPNGVGSSVVFSDAVTITNPSDAHITLDGNYTLAYLSFESANNIILDPGSGGSLTFSNQGNSAAITARQSQNQINVPVSTQEDINITVGESEEDITLAGAPAIKANASFSDPTSLTLSAGITVASGKFLAKYGEGTLYTAFVRGGSLGVGEGTLQIIPNGTAAAASRVDAVFVEGDGTLDLTNNSLLVHNAAPADIQPLLQYQRIISSTAQANPGHAIADLTGAEFLTLHPGAQFDGAAVASTDMLLKYTYAGDATLDGKITVADYAQIDAAFLLGNFDGVTNIADWFNGDFNYDGIIDYQDYALIDFAFQVQSGALADDMIAAHTAEFGADYRAALQSLQATVPEPASLAIAALGVPALLLRKKRGRTA